MNSKVYKWCAVPQCNNTSKKTPNKVFVYVPSKKTMRNKWLKLARRDAKFISPNSSIYFCEDHFDLPNDMENYIQYHVMGLVSQVRMKPGCIPTRFECQPDRRKRTCNSVQRQYILKKQRKLIVEECVKDFEERSMLTKHLEPAETSSEISGNVANEVLPQLLESTEKEAGQESNLSEQDSNHSWIVKCESVDLPKDEPELSDDVPDNLSLYCDDDTTSATSKGDKDEQRHEGYQCDNCNSDIIGYRYTCVQCNNFDVCFACESRGAHPHHYMLRVPAPRPFNEIQTVLVTIRKYLMKKLDPISTNEFESEDAISVKSEIKSETMDMDEDIEAAEQVFDTSIEYTANHELTQHSMLTSDGSVHLTNTDSEEASQSDKVVPRQVKASNSTQEITEKPVQKVRLTKSVMKPIESPLKISKSKQEITENLIREVRLTKSDVEPPDSQVKISNVKQEIIQNPIQTVRVIKSDMESPESQVMISNAKDTNQSPLIIKMAKQCKLVTPSTAKRKIVLKRSDLVDLEQSNLLAKKLCVMSTTAQETMKKPIILSRKPAVKLLNIPLSTLKKQGQTASSQLGHQQEPKTTAEDRKS